MNNLSRTVHLYTIRLDASATEVSACRRLLSEDEVARADRFVSKSTADGWQVCRARLRQILASYCEVEANAIRFTKQENGKPVIAAGLCDADLHFNLSHSHHLAVVSVTKVGAIGVDVEYLRTIGNWERVAARFFSAHEQAQLALVGADLRPRAFYECWTRKEAVIKATGEGLSASLDSFDVSLGPGVQAAVLADRSGHSDDKLWQMDHFEPETGYVAAFAVRSTQIVRWQDKSTCIPDLATA